MLQPWGQGAGAMKELFHPPVESCLEPAVTPGIPPQALLQLLPHHALLQLLPPHALLLPLHLLILLPGTLACSAVKQVVTTQPAGKEYSINNKGY